MLTTDLDYDLPPDRIATEPAEPRDAARLMVVWRGTDRVQHTTIEQLPRLTGAVGRDDLMVFNRTKVLPAHFSGTRTATGGKVGGLYVGSPDGDHCLVLLEARGTLQVGEQLALEEGSHFELIEPRGAGQWLVRRHSGLDTVALLNCVGTTPLPPYIRKQRRARGLAEVRPQDASRYNTVFADQSGSVAAPTAALHFTPRVLDELDAAGVRRAMLTLHIGLGTFAPIRSESVEKHAIHEEWISIPATTVEALRQARDRGGRVVPVGTTCVRALESLPHPPPPGEEHSRQTNLFIHPGEQPFPFRFTDALLTNFHLPRSTLLALVAALPGVGLDRLKHWYQIAIEDGYRFYSYGDAMFIV